MARIHMMQYCASNMRQPDCNKIFHRIYCTNCFPKICPQHEQLSSTKITSVLDYITLSSVACLALPYFCTSHKNQEKNVWNIKCVFRLSVQLLSETFLLL